MKQKLSTGVSILISIVLVVAGLGLGAYRGFSKERQSVTSLLQGDSGLMNVLMLRGADGLNLASVAQRHIGDAPELTELLELCRSLASTNGSLSQKQELDDQLDGSVDKVIALLESTDSYLASHRDQRYVSMLRSDMNSLADQSFLDEYTAAADAFNQKLSGSFMGTIASIMGIKPCNADNVVASEAAVRLPEEQGAVTDDANALSSYTVDDIEEYADMVEDETDVNLHVALVHFTDGLEARKYGEKLFDHWELGDEDVLILGVIGEDSFHMVIGEDVQKKISASTADDLFHISTPFSQLFGQYQYDQAFGQLFRGLNTLLNKQYREDMELGNLFKESLVFSQQAQNNFNSASWASTLGNIVDLENHFEDKQENGLGVVHWILLIGLLLIIINGSDPVRKAKKRHRRR